MHKPFHRKEGDPHTERTAGKAEQKSLSKHLANDSRACRAQCHANGGFAHAAGNARQEKARKIGANDEQDHANGTEKKDQPETRRADDLSFEGLKPPTRPYSRDR